jgi:ATP-dependent protease ClpP protease subunit
MPIRSHKDSKGCYMQYGGQAKYYYTCGDSEARERAKEKAAKQAAAIKISQSKNMSDFQFIKNIAEDNSEATILLYKPIGSFMDESGNIVEGINGNAFATELLYLETQVKRINVRINSIGGSVLEGYSIISAILNSKAEIHTYNDGLAASIAGIIFICGKVRHMYDYSINMIHNPSGTENESVLDVIKNSLVTILNNNSILIESELETLMTNETYFNADESLRYNLVDNVISSNAKVSVKSKNKYEMMEVFNKLIINEMEEVKNEVEIEVVETEIESVENKLGIESPTTLTNEEETEVETLEGNEVEPANEDLEEDTEVAPNNYSRLKTHMGLTDESDEDSMMNAYSSMKEMCDSLTKENEALKTKLEEVAKEAKKAHKAKIDKMVNQLFVEGKIEKTEIDTVTKLADFDFEATKNMFSKVGTVRATSISSVINKSETINPKEGWSIRDYEKKDPAKLTEIKNSTPALYAQLFREYYGVDPK